MQRTIADALDTWREAERVLEGTPEDSPDHAEVLAAMASARAVYQSLFHAAQRGVTVTEEELTASRAAVATARVLLEARRRGPRAD